MMKTFGIAVALLLVLAVGAIADTGMIDLYMAYDFSLIAVPKVPVDPSPATLFAGHFPSYALFRFDPTIPGM